MIARERELLARGSARACRGGQHGLNRNFHLAFLSPHSAPGLRYQHGRGFDPGIALASESLSPSRRCARATCGVGWTCIRRSFGMRPQGVWPSEGSVSEEVLRIAHEPGREMDGHRRRRAGAQPGSILSRATATAACRVNLAREALHHPSLRERPDRDAPDFPRSHHLGPDRLRLFRHASAGRGAII